jgi:signal transduction histidine kinase
LSNAVKYSPDVKAIGFSATHLDGRIAITVSDTGIGIPRAEIPFIFDKFYRVESGLVHNTKGSGLGLAIARQIVQAHRGTIAVESEPGQGSRFTILLPAA